MLSVQFKKVFIVNTHIKRHIIEKHYSVIITMLIELIELNKQGSAIQSRSKLISKQTSLDQ